MQNRGRTPDNAGVRVRRYLIALTEPLVFVIVGLIVVFGSILMGYTMEHGHIIVLIQWSEFITIGGCATGAFLVSNPMSVVKGSIASVLSLLKPNPYNEKAYAELLQVLYDVFQKARKDGLVGLESHIEDPESSEIFKKYTFFRKNHHALPFLWRRWRRSATRFPASASWRRCSAS